MMNRPLVSPQVIFLDAVGTLFGVHGTVGEIYGEFAAAAGVEVDDQRLNQAFIASFRAAPRAAFPGADPDEIPGLELRWWRAIAHQSFTQVGVIDQLEDFDSFFQLLFDHFATPTPWIVYPEVPEMLYHWQQQGIPLGVISNFDSRLHRVLKALDLAQFFSTVTISTAVGAAKPSPDIFQAALARYNCAPTAAWHIGDSWPEDYQGAQGAGLQGIWLNRELRSRQPEQQNAVMIADLTALRPQT